MSAAEIFQYVICQIIQPSKHAFNYSDDILVFGATQKEHDKALTQVCHLLGDAGLILKAEKCEFHKIRLKFLGRIFSEKGMTPDPEKVEALSSTCPWRYDHAALFPRRDQLLCRLHDFATVSVLLRELTKWDVRFEWSSECDQTFKEIKHAIENVTENA